MLDRATRRGLQQLFAQLLAVAVMLLPLISYVPAAGGAASEAPTAAAHLHHAAQPDAMAAGAGGEADGDGAAARPDSAGAPATPGCPVGAACIALGFAGPPAAVGATATAAAPGLVRHAALPGRHVPPDSRPPSLRA